MSTKQQGTKQQGTKQQGTNPQGTKHHKVLYSLVTDLINSGQLPASVWQTMVDAKKPGQKSFILEEAQATYSLVTTEHIEIIKQSLKDQQAKDDARKAAEIKQRKESARKLNEEKRKQHNAKVEKYAATIRQSGQDVNTLKRHLEKITAKQEELTVHVQGYQKVCKEYERISKKAKKDAEKAATEPSEAGSSSPVPMSVPMPECLRSA